MQSTFAKRRTVFLGAWAAAALGYIGRTFSQQRKSVLIGWLHPGPSKADGHYLTSFKEGMTALGWTHGVTFTVEERWMESKVERQQALAEELAVKKPSVVVVFGTFASRAMAKASAATPIVQVADYPVEAGLAKSLARPGGMVTGLMNIAFELAEKRSQSRSRSAGRSSRVILSGPRRALCSAMAPI